MKVRLNDDREVVKTVREGLKRTGGVLPLPPGPDRGEQVYVQGVQGPNRRSGL